MRFQGFNNMCTAQQTSKNKHYKVGARNRQNMRRPKEEEAGDEFEERLDKHKKKKKTQKRTPKTRPSQ